MKRNRHAQGHALDSRDRYAGSYGPMNGAHNTTEKVKFMALADSTLNNTEIRELANSIRTSVPPIGDTVDVTALAVANEFSVRQFRTKPGIQSFIIVDDTAPIKGLPEGEITHRLIGYSLISNSADRRGGIGHELGHFYLHKGNLPVIYDACPSPGAAKYTDAKDETANDQAELFARVLLIPAKEFSDRMKAELNMAGINEADNGTNHTYIKTTKIFQSLGQRFVMTPRNIAQRVSDDDPEIKTLRLQYPFLKGIAETYVQDVDSNRIDTNR